jgi:hypothetical protein
MPGAEGLGHQGLPDDVDRVGAARQALGGDEHVVDLTALAAHACRRSRRVEPSAWQTARGRANPQGRSGLPQVQRIRPASTSERACCSSKTTITVKASSAHPASVEAAGLSSQGATGVQPARPDTARQPERPGLYGSDSVNISPTLVTSRVGVHDGAAHRPGPTRTGNPTSCSRRTTRSHSHVTVPRDAQHEAGLSRAVTPSESDDLLHSANVFMALVENTVGGHPR